MNSRSPIWRCARDCEHNDLESKRGITHANAQLDGKAHERPPRSDATAVPFAQEEVERHQILSRQACGVSNTTRPILVGERTSAWTAASVGSSNIGLWKRAALAR